MISNSRKVVGAIIFSFLPIGILDASIPGVEDTSAFLHGLLIAIALFVWCGLHAEDENIALPSRAKLFCGLLGMIGVTIYLFRAFGFKKGGVKFLLGLVGIGISGAIYMGAFYATDTIFF